jgi:eukaryotic-like serine/threonine-protein kinase
VSGTDQTSSPEAQNRDVWIIDIARNVPSRQTFDPGIDTSPVWSPDGTRIAFAGSRSGKFTLRQKLVNGTAADEVLLEESRNIFPSDWSADGRFIAYWVGGTAPSKPDVWILPLFGDRKPFPLAETQFAETEGVFSPDGRWMAYTSDESGLPNVYVQSFPAAGRKSQVSRDAGGFPAWRGDGRELFYVGIDGNMMAVPVNTTGQFEAGVPQALFQSGSPTNNAFQYAVTKDGQRFLINARPQRPGGALTVLVNWTAAIQK